MSSNEFKYSGNAELVNVEVALGNYNDWIISQIVDACRHLNNDSKILDFGAGIGTLASILHEKISNEIQCLELDSLQLARCREQGFYSFEKFQSESQKFDFIYSSNVLEHIVDDFSVVKDLVNHLNSGGILFTYVPAHNFLWTDMDTKVGHHRRYSRRRLKSLMNDNNLSIESIKYVDCIGVVAMLAVKLLGFKPQSGLGSVRSLEIYDKFVWPISKLLDRFFRFFIGKNLLVIAVKK